MSYHQFAYIYDELMSHAPYDAWAEFTSNIIKKKNTPVNKIVDLGCGTGEIAIRLAKLGYDVIGVDLSSDMLACASDKATKQNISINWIKQDVRNLSGFHNIDLFTSYCDVINYITKTEDVKTVFQHVYKSLSLNGLFIFDIHNIRYAESHLMNHTFTDVTDELAYIWDCEQGEHRGEMFHHLTFFKKDADKYIRFDELHHQQTYDISIYEQLLKKCGYSKIEFYSDFQSEKDISIENSERIFIVAQK